MTSFGIRQLKYLGFATKLLSHQKGVASRQDFSKTFYILLARIRSFHSTYGPQGTRMATQFQESRRPYSSVARDTGGIHLQTKHRQKI